MIERQPFVVAAVTSRLVGSLNSFKGRLVELVREQNLEVQDSLLAQMKELDELYRQVNPYFEALLTRRIRPFVDKNKELRSNDAKGLMKKVERDCIWQPASEIIDEPTKIDNLPRFSHLSSNSRIQFANSDTSLIIEELRFVSKSGPLKTVISASTLTDADRCLQCRSMLNIQSIPCSGSLCQSVSSMLIKSTSHQTIAGLRDIHWMNVSDAGTITATDYNMRTMMHDIGTGQSIEISHYSTVCIVHKDKFLFIENMVKVGNIGIAVTHCSFENHRSTFAQYQKKDSCGSYYQVSIFVDGELKGELDRHAAKVVGSSNGWRNDGRSWVSDCIWTDRDRVVYREAGSLRLVQASLEDIRKGIYSTVYFKVPPEMSMQKVNHFWMGDGKYAILWRKGNYIESDSKFVVQSPLIDGLFCWMLIRGLPSLGGIVTLSMATGNSNPSNPASKRQITISSNLKSKTSSAIFESNYIDSKAIVSRVIDVRQTGNYAVMLAAGVVRYVHVFSVSRSGVCVLKSNIDASMNGDSGRGKINTLAVFDNAMFVSYGQENDGAKYVRMMLDFN